MCVGGAGFFAGGRCLVILGFATLGLAAFQIGPERLGEPVLFFLTGAFLVVAHGDGFWFLFLFWFVSFILFIVIAVQLRQEQGQKPGTIPLLTARQNFRKYFHN